VLGHSHALSGLAAGAVTLPWAPVHGAVGQAAWVAAAGGFAMLPDLDQRGSTISRMWGPASDIPSGVVGTVARGHRWGTHDAVLAPLLFGFLASLAADWFWASLLVLAMSIGLALRALHFVIPGKAENTVIGNLLLSWGGAWLVLDNIPSPAWLPWAVMLGVLTHIAGDLLTCEGVPVPLVWVIGRSRLKLSPMRTGTVLETAVLVPAFLTIAIVFAYLNTPARQAVDPLLDRLTALG
jgi:membrane-bound metal-dependent hydrolase YbcI (DUF457 family)